MTFEVFTAVKSELCVVCWVKDSGKPEDGGDIFFWNTGIITEGITYMFALLLYNNQLLILYFFCSRCLGNRESEDTYCELTKTEKKKFQLEHSIGQWWQIRVQLPLSVCRTTYYTHVHTWLSRKAISVYAVRARPLPAPPCISWWLTFPTSGKLPFEAWFVDSQCKASWIIFSSTLIYGIACWKDLATKAVSLKT